MIKLANLSKYYYSGNSVALGLRKVNLDFAEKEFVVITGESGSGKTTLLSTISGLLPYEEGELYVEGKPTSHFDEEDWESYRKEYIAFVFQNYNLIDSYTVLENVMAVLLIQGIDKKSAKETALNYLEKVGLTDYITHHASELSSGQKQRLSIARALAKNTKIIVADEPTGNLDAENGKQVMELLSKLAQDRLVLVVTHNYEEAAPFASRKVRIYDGEVVEDIQINKRSEADKESPTTEEKLQQVVRISPKKIGHIFTAMELSARKRRGILFTSLLFFVAVATFLFFGNVLANLDDTSTRVYTNEAFSNIDERRIAVRHSDGSPMTEEDLKVLEALENVEEVDLYGLSNDIFYFCEEGNDYTVNIVHTNAGFAEEGEATYEKSIYLEKYEKFVRSASCLTQEDLAYGTLPEGINEVVLYTEDESLLGSTITCLFSDAKNWPTNTYCRLEMTVCGILKEETTQYFFSDATAKMLSLSAYEYSQGYYCYNRVSGEKTEDGLITRYNGSMQLQSLAFYTDDTYQGETKYHVVLPRELFDVGEQIFGVSFYFKTSKDGGYEGYDFLLESDIVLPYGYTKAGNTPTGGVSEEYIESACSIGEEAHLSSNYMLLISRELYDEMTADFYSPQASVFVSDYAYVDDVMKVLNDAGYEAVSPYRIGAIAYDEAKVTERLVTLGLSIAALIVLLVLETFILKALLKNGKNDCLVLKSIGMEQQILGRVQINTMLCYCVMGFVPMFIVAWILNEYVPQVHALVVYYRIYHWVILLAMNLMAVFVTACLHNRHLKQLIVAGIE